MNKALQVVDRAETLKRGERPGKTVEKGSLRAGKLTMNVIKTKPRYLVATALAAGLMLAGCQGEKSLIPHKLVATPNEHSVPMYPDEEIYLKVSRMQQEGGVGRGYGRGSAQELQRERHR